MTRNGKRLPGAVFSSTLFAAVAGGRVVSFFKRLFGKSEDGNNPADFDAFVDGALEGLQIQTAACQGTWGLGSEEDWSFDQEDGRLVLTFSDKIVTTPAQIIGSFDGDSKTWLWAWANSSIEPALARDAEKVRAYGERHGVKRLVDRKWPADEVDGWRMTALANRICNSGGAYRGAAGSAYVYFTFGKLNIKPRG